MAFKRMAAAQHMNAEVALMSAMVFSQFTHLVDLGASVGYGETEPVSDDPMEALVLDLLAMDKPNKASVDLVLQKHLRVADSDSEIVKLMKSWGRRKV